MSCFSWRNRLRRDYVTLVHRGHVSSAIAPPDEATFTTKVAEEKVDEIAQDSLSSCLQARKVFQGVRLSDRCYTRRRGPQKCASKIKEMWTKTNALSCLRLRRLSNPTAEFSAPIPYLGMILQGINYWDVFLGDISFYLVLDFVWSFSSRSYPPVRKCTDYCGMNMSTTWH